MRQNGKLRTREEGSNKPKPPNHQATRLSLMVVGLTTTGLQREALERPCNYQLWQKPGFPSIQTSDDIGSVIQEFNSPCLEILPSTLRVVQH